MMVMARDGDYEGVLEDLVGRSVLVWTCNTCARLCGGLGGREAAERLAERLVADGVDVRGVVSTGASCLVPKVESAAEGIADRGFDAVLVLNCDLGALCVGRVLGKEVINPVITFGPGYLDDGGVPRLCSVVCGRTVMDESLDEVAGRMGAGVGPFVRPEV